jgi:hypothetical protein
MEASKVMLSTPSYHPIIHVWLVVWNIWIIHSVIPTDFHSIIFQRGQPQTIGFSMETIWPLGYPHDYGSLRPRLGRRGALAVPFGVWYEVVLAQLSEKALAPPRFLDPKRFQHMVEVS